MAKARTFRSEAEGAKAEAHGNTPNEAIEVTQAETAAWHERQAAHYAAVQATAELHVADASAHDGLRRFHEQAASALRNNTALEMREAAARVAEEYPKLLDMPDKLIPEHVERNEFGEEWVVAERVDKMRRLANGKDIAAAIRALPISPDPLPTVPVGWQAIESAPTKAGDIGPEFLAADYLMLGSWNMLVVRITAKGQLVNAWDHSVVEAPTFAPTLWLPLPLPASPSSPAPETSS